MVIIEAEHPLGQNGSSYLRLGNLIIDSSDRYHNFDTRCYSRYHTHHIDFGRIGTRPPLGNINCYHNSSHSFDPTAALSFDRNCNSPSFIERMNQFNFNFNFNHLPKRYLTVDSLVHLFHFDSGQNQLYLILGSPNRLIIVE